MADSGDQLRLQQEINKALQERQKLLEANTRILGRQAQVARDLCKSLDCSNLKNMENAANGFGDAIEQASQKSTENLSGMGQTAQNVSEKLENLGKKASALAVLTSALKGMRQGFSLTMGIVKGFGKGIFSLIGTVFNLGRSIISLPFKILGGLLNMANQGGISPFRVALEELRKEMGDFSAGPAKDIVDSVYNIRRSFNNSSMSAVGFGRIFGYGREGLANALKFTTELAKGVGPIFDSMSAEFEKNAGKLAIFNKGMGISAEVMGQMIASHKASGKDYMKTFTEMAHYSDHFAKKFNMSAKNISRDAATMSVDIAHFGDMSTKEMIELTVQMKRTGVEMKTLQGIVDKFDNFEDAARSAALLRRQFGMMIDARKMMAMNAGERAAYIKEQFHATGRSFEDMHRLEIKALTRTSGIEEKQLKMLLGRGNKEKKLSDVQKEGNKAQQIQINQLKLLKKLSKDIERQFQSGSGYTSFFQAFVAGIEKGVRRTREFRKLMINLKRGLRTVERAGIRIGRAFVKHFPGVKEMLGSMAEFFSPGRMVPNMRRVSNAFEALFKSIRNPRDISRGLDQFFNSMKKVFGDFFGGASGIGSNFAQASDVFMTVVGNLKLRIMDKAADSAASFLTAFTEGLRNFLDGDQNLGVGNVAQKIGEGFNSRFGDSFNQLSSTIKNKLFPALQDAAPVIFEALGTLMDKIRGYLSQKKVADKLYAGLVKSMEFLWKMKMGYFKYLFENKMYGKLLLISATFLGPAVAFGLMKGMGTLLLLKMPKLLFGIFGKVFPGAAAKAGAGMAAAKGAFATAAAGLGKGLVGLFKVGLRAAPWAVVAYGAVKGVSAGFERGGAAAVGAFTQAVTFGLVDGDWIEEALGGEKRYTEKIVNEITARSKKAYKAGLDQIKPLVEQTRKDLKLLGIAAGETEVDFGSMAVQFDKQLSAGAKASLENLTGLFKKQEGYAKRALKDSEAAQKTEAAANVALQTYIDAKDKQFNEKFVTLPIQDRKARLDLLKRLRAEYGKDAVKSVKYGDGDFKLRIDGNIARLGAIEHYIEQWQGKYKDYAKRVTDAAQGAANYAHENNILKLTREELLKTKDELVQAGATPAQLQKLQSMLDKKSGLEAMKRALLDGKVDINVLKAKGIEAAFKEITTGSDKDAAAAVKGLYQKYMQEMTASAVQITEEDKQAAKLGQLEAAQDTIKRIRELEKVPEELKSAQDAFKNIKVEDIKSGITDFFCKIADITKEITGAITTAGLDKPNAIVSGTVMDNFGSITSARSALDSIFKTKTVPAQTLAARQANIKAAVTAAGKIYEKLGEGIEGKTKINATSLENALSTVRVATSSIVGEGGIFDQRIPEISRKIKGTQSAADEIIKLTKKLKRIPELKAVLNMSDRFTSGEDISVTVSNASINLKVEVKLEAEKLVKEIVKVEFNNGSEGKTRLATEKSVANAVNDV